MERTPITKAECLATNKIVMEKLDKLDESLDAVKSTLESLPSKLTLELDNRYASKRVEQNVDRLAWLVISGIVVAILAVVIV